MHYSENWSLKKKNKKKNLNEEIKVCTLPCIADEDFYNLRVVQWQQCLNFNLANS